MLNILINRTPLIFGLFEVSIMNSSALERDQVGWTRDKVQATTAE
jgi:hypothetical protein